MRLCDLPNIGPVLEQKLISIGVSTSEDLKLLGSKAAFMQLFLEDSFCCLNLLLSLEGAIQYKPKHLLDSLSKECLKELYHEVKA